MQQLAFTAFYEYSNVERGQEHGIEGTDLNFKFKMASVGNVVFIDCHIMDVTFLISLTLKKFFLSPPPFHSCLFLVLQFVYFRRLIALTFTGNTCLMKVRVCICTGFSEFNKPAMCNIVFTQPFFSIMYFVLPFQTEHSTYFILIKVCHFVGRLKHKCLFYFFHFSKFLRLEF